MTFAFFCGDVRASGDGAAQLGRVGAGADEGRT
jgi:hypothetical protein